MGAFRSLQKLTALAADRRVSFGMTPDIIEEGEDLMPPKRSSLYLALARLPGFRKEPPPEVPDALVEAAQIESAFFASYL